ncbi:MAG: hypothetical protein IBJ14_14440 [Hydrogenophaga sp.]|nr:hypothetical protein [Hydrogenophaga sp.]
MTAPTRLRRAAFGLLPALVLALAACADGYGTEEPLVLDDDVSLARAIEVMNLTDRQVRGVRGTREQRFAVEGDCRLRVAAESPGDTPLVHTPLGGLEVEVSGSGEAQNRFETWVRPRGGERVRVLPAAAWTEATQMRWLIEHAARVCPRAAHTKP